MKKKSEAFEKRIHELDLFRGFLILLVIIDHLVWSINFYCFNSAQPFLSSYWTSTFRLVMRQLVLFAFMFTCGISCTLSRNNKKRGAILFAICILITIATYSLQLLPIFNNRVIKIDCNILLVISLSILIYSVFQHLSNKNLWLVTGALMLMYFFVLLSQRTTVTNEFNHFQSILFSHVDPIKNGYVADYLPLFPYIIALFIGAIFARKFFAKTPHLFKKRDWERPICFLGRHTLIVYIAHEIIFTIVFMGIGAIIK
ncbi:MAG: DUF1624 domain-containing protein [Bacilli bacterium]|nr:DUF1624 domain-containing protein [Bacilli bacterium]